jgi:heme/copper-type cytochrome/quinol oxidase subunit 2
LLVGIVSVFLIAACAQQSAQPAAQPVVEPTVQAETPALGKEGVEEMVVAPASVVKEFDIEAKQWSFEPSIISVNEGDTVKLNIESIDVTHGFALFEFDVNERLAPGKTVTVEFIADKAGEYTFFCSVPCGSGHGSMNGKLIVE